MEGISGEIGRLLRLLHDNFIIVKKRKYHKHYYVVIYVDSAKSGYLPLSVIDFAIAAYVNKCGLMKISIDNIEKIKLITDELEGRINDWCKQNRNVGNAYEGS